jgi:uncharacterized protein (DUF4415 family)
MLAISSCVITSTLPSCDSEVTDRIRAERGRFQRPIKQQVTLRIYADMLAWFKARLQGFQWGHAEPGRAGAADNSPD